MEYAPNKEQILSTVNYSTAQKFYIFIPHTEKIYRAKFIENF